MKPSRLNIQAASLTSSLRADVLLIPFTLRGRRPGLPDLRGLPMETRRALVAFARRYHGGKQAGSIDDLVLYKSKPWGRLALVNLGDSKPAKPADIRTTAGVCVEWCAKHKARTVVVLADGLVELGGKDAPSLWTEGAILGSFKFLSRRSGPPENAGIDVRRLTLATASRSVGALSAGVRRTVALGECVNLARDLGHEPPNVLNPVTLARRAQGIARRFRLTCRVFDDRRLCAMKMGAFLAAGSGSASKPRMIILEHRGGPRAGRPIVFVGKAVTHDTGGYSIKPTASMVEMKYDKCGGMAVIGALVAAARLKLRRRIIGVIGAAENMISGESYRPGDIIRAASGKTIEVLDTDAEGRLILADCLHFAEKAFKPGVLIDLATLTGACSVALGDACAGLFANNDALANSLVDAGERTGERLWRLPLWPVYREQIVGGDADIKNVGGRGAGAITAALFLKEFVQDKTAWAHLDIAGVANTTKASPICPVGATGFGVRLLIDYIQRLP